MALETAGCFLSSGTFLQIENELQETHRKGEAGFSCRQGKHYRNRR